MHENIENLINEQIYDVSWKIELYEMLIEKFLLFIMNYEMLLL